jgi:uncharacterized protein with von Willebrand factor type A (vWA) domain
MEQREQQNKSKLDDYWQQLVGGSCLEDLHAAIAGGRLKIFAQGLNRWALCYGLSRLLPRFKRTILLITPSPKQAWEAHQSLSVFLGLSE